MEDTRFGFDPYHILLVALGASLLVSCWLPHLFVRRPPAATTLPMACGMVDESSMKRANAVPQNKERAMQVRVALPFMKGE
jgi:hypothetical protein